MATTNTIFQRIAVQGTVEVINQLREMGAAGEAAIRQIQTATGAAVSPLAALHAATEHGRESLGKTAGAVGNLEAAIGPAISRLNRFTQSFEELRGVVGALAPAMKEFVEIGIGAGFLLAARSAASATRDLVDQAHNLGTTVKEIEGLKYAFASQGIAAEGFNRIIDRFAARLGEAQRKSEEFGQSQSLQAEERRIQAEKFQDSMRRDEEAIARSRREQGNANEELKRAAIEQERLRVAIEQRVSGTEKLKEATDKLYNAQTGVNRQTNLQAYDQNIKREEMNIKVGESRLSLETQLRRVQETRINAQEAARAATDRLRVAQDEYNLSQEKARIESEKSKDEFTRLGIALKGANGEYKGTVEVLLEIFDKLHTLPNAAERANIMLKLFGRNWAEAARAMKLGGDRLKELMDEFEKTGAGLTEDEINMGEKFNASFEKMLAVLDGMKNAIGNILGQALIPLFDAVSDFFSTNQKTIREFASAFSVVLGGALKQFIEAFRDVGSRVSTILGYIKAAFDGVARDINKLFGTNFTGAELIVALVLFRVSIGRISSIIAGLLGMVGTLVGGLIRLAAAFRIVGTAIIAIDLKAFLAAIGPGGWIVLGLIAIGAAATALGVNWGTVWDSMLDKITNAYYGLKIFVLLLGEALKGIGGLDKNPLIATGAAANDQGSSLSAGDFGKRVEEENPGLFQKREGGGWIGGHGSGDHVPVLAEPGEFMVNRTAARPFRGFLEALNAGLVRGFSMGGIVDRLSNVGPAPLSVGMGSLPGARPSQDTAMFHLTIDGRTFQGLTAPRSTAEDLVQHARTSSLISAARPPSRKGR